MIISWCIITIFFVTSFSLKIGVLFNLFYKNNPLFSIRKCISNHIRHIMLYHFEKGTIKNQVERWFKKFKLGNTNFANEEEREQMNHQISIRHFWFLPIVLSPKSSREITVLHSNFSRRQNEYGYDFHDMIFIIYTGINFRLCQPILIYKFIDSFILLLDVYFNLYKLSAILYTYKLLIDNEHLL